MATMQIKNKWQPGAYLEVGRHGLVVLVLDGEGVAVGEPGGAEEPVDLGGLAQVPASKQGLHDVFGQVTRAGHFRHFWMFFL